MMKKMYMLKTQVLTVAKKFLKEENGDAIGMWIGIGVSIIICLAIAALMFPAVRDIFTDIIENIQDFFSEVLS